MTTRKTTAGRAAMATLLIQAGLLLAAAPPATAQGFIPPEIPFTHKYGFGARAAGMGYAHGAVAEDGSALWFNPAGLAQVRRIEISGGILHDTQDRATTFDTATDGFPGTGPSTTDIDISETQLTHVNFVYPFPTYRGSMVLGLGYQRLMPLTSDYYREGVLVEPGATPGMLESERFTEDGSIELWTVGFAGDVSPNISLGGTLSYADGESRQDFRVGRYRYYSNGATDIENSPEVFEQYEIRQAEVNGWTWSAGLMGRLGEQARMGLTVFGGEYYDFEGIVDGTFEDQEKIDSYGYSFIDQIDLPMSFLGSLAFTPNNFVLAADFRFTDWSQIDFEGAVEAPGAVDAYESTVDINLGAEYQFQEAPLRVRAGYAYEPLPYQLEPADIDFTFVPDDGDPDTVDDASYFTRAYPEATFETNRHFITAGVGVLLEETLNLDFAYVHGIYERSGGSFSEKWTTDRLYATASVRF